MAERMIQAQVVVAGEAEGKLMILPEPLSLWGGLDPQTGQITDQHHPSCGSNVTGRILMMPSGRGSSSASSILLEAIRLKTAPAAIITSEMDGILALGAVVAQELYESSLPVLVLGGSDYATLQNEQEITIDYEGMVHLLR